MHWWQNLRTLWPGALRQQVTRTGLAYSGAIVIVTLAAVLSANNLLFLILAAMLSILAISGFVSKLTLAGLEIDLLLPPHISARRTIRATVRLKNLTVPVLNIFASKDHLVPPSASIPLGAHIGSQDYQSLEVDAGHIGLYVGRKTSKSVPAAVTAWLQAKR